MNSISNRVDGVVETVSAKPMGATGVSVRFFEESDKMLPLEVSPPNSTDNSADYLESWIVGNRQWVEGELVKYGAVLFRGFSVTTPQQFERLARAIRSELKNNYLGTSPRNGLTDYVFSASE